MTAAKQNLLKVAKKSGNKMLMVKLALLDEVCNAGAVNLDNAYYLIQDEVTPKEFAGYLSALTKEGFYEPSDDPMYKGSYGYILKQS